MSKLILCCDGGGIRGAATTQFLKRVEDTLKENHGKSIRDCVDFYAGTSTGALIALGLATTQMPVSKINDLYSFENAQKIFSDNQGWFEIDGINAPKYEAGGKTTLLESSLGDAKISDVPSGKHVLAVTYAIERRQPLIIKSTDSRFSGLKSFAVADASSAAPTYFPTKDIQLADEDDEHWLVDGGVTANNPTMCAIAEAKRAWPDISVDDIRVISIGTGYRTRKINGPESQKWGAINWFRKGHILDVLTDEKVVAYQAITIMQPGNYIRINSEMKPQPGMTKAPDDAMDDVSASNIRRLKMMGDFWFNRYGDAVVSMLLNEYQGPSLDRVDPTTGEPVIHG